MKFRSFNLLIVLVLFLSLLGGAVIVTPARAETGDLLPITKAMLNENGTLNLPSGFSGSLNLDGWNVQLDAAHGPVFRPATLPANTWSALTDKGLNDFVFALAVAGTDLYVGGWFTETYDGSTTGLNNIAKYNTSNKTWSALTDNGLDGTVLALAVVGTDLYVGGEFTQTNGGATTGLNNIAKYNTSNNTWSALTDNGLNGQVQGFGLVGTDLYVGGFFGQTFGGATTGLNGIAKYNTSNNTWSALADNGLNQGARAFAVVGTDLYVGGEFMQTSGGATTGLSRIAKYNTSNNTWSALTDNGLLGVQVNALTVVGTDLYVGGDFTQTTGGATTGLNSIAKYNTSNNTWSALTDNGLGGGLGGTVVTALAVIDTDLYVGGVFAQTNGGATTGLNDIARYNTSNNTWSALTDNGLSNNPRALAVAGTDLYVGGAFNNTFGSATRDLNNIARYSYLQQSPTFADVPFDYWAWQYIESIYQAGITGGCSTNPLSYCPTQAVTRAQMAVFLLKGIHGSSYTPPAVNGSTGFTDVATDYWAAAWIKQLAAEGITGGCGAGIYCPENTVTRDQMAVFLLRAEHGSAYTPPAVGAGTGFTDVPVDYWAAAWIKQLAAEAITGGCGSGVYCPANPVTRDQMAVFLQKTFNLPLP